jgi:hypothetical protein
MAQRIVNEMDFARFGVKGVYLIGSTRNATGGPEADIDLIIHHDGPAASRHELELWLDGWSLALAELNFQRSGHKARHLLDLRFVTSDDIANQAGVAAKIGAAADAARRISPGGNF